MLIALAVDGKGMLISTHENGYQENIMDKDK